MQYKLTEYNPEVHDIFVCLSVKNPYARMIAEGKKTVELRSRNVKYRGELVICSSSVPEGEDSGCTLAIANLYDVKKAKDLTPQEWEMTGIPEDKRYLYAKNTAWMLKDSRPIKKVPIKGQLGIYRIALTKGDL